MTDKLDPFNPENDDSENQTDWKELAGPIIRELWLHKWRIVIVSFLLTAAFLGFLLLLPNMYRASAKILPSSDAGNLGQYANLASLVGISLPGAGDNQALLPDIVYSERILGKLADRQWKYSESDTLVYFKDLFEIEPWNVSAYPEVEVRKLLFKYLREKVIGVDVDRKTNVATISALIPDDPRLAMEVVNFLVDEVNAYNNSFRITKSMEEKLFLEQRLPEVEKELKAAEEILKNFEIRERNWQQSPELRLERGRLERNVTIANSIWSELTRQYEVVKLNVLREKMTLDILDYATIPAIKESPRRITLTLVAGFFIGVATAGFYAFRSYLVALVNDLLGMINQKGAE